MNSRTKTILLIVAFIAVVACIPASYYFGRTSGHQDVVDATKRELDNFGHQQSGQAYIKLGETYASVLTPRERESMKNIGQAQLSEQPISKEDKDRSAAAVYRIGQAKPGAVTELLKPINDAYQLQTNANNDVIEALKKKLN